MVSMVSKLTRNVRCFEGGGRRKDGKDGKDGKDRKGKEGHAADEFGDMINELNVFN